MKRMLITASLLCLCFVLCGCSSIYTNRQDIESLLVMETIGLDAAEEGVSVSLSSGASVGEGGEKTAPVTLSDTGPSISGVIDAMHAQTTGKELFCAHTTNIVIGEEAARDGIEDYIDYVCRSPDMRLGVPVFVVQGESAETALKGAKDDESGITELLRAAKTDLDGRGSGRVFNAGEILRDIERFGATLVPAVMCEPKEEGGSVEDGCTVNYCGYAVFKGWSLADFIPRDEALGVDFLENDVDICDVTVNTPDGEAVTLEIVSGDCYVRPVCSAAGKLAQLDVYAQVSATLMEASAAGEEPDSSELTALLEEAVSDAIRSTLLLSQRLGADFIGLAGSVESAAPYLFREMDGGFEKALESLSFRVTVTGSISHTNDLKEG